MVELTFIQKYSYELFTALFAELNVGVGKWNEKQFWGGL